MSSESTTKEQKVDVLGLVREQDRLAYVDVRLRVQAQQRKQREAQAQHVTNASFARSNEQFIAACGLAGIEPTARQASKFRRRTGKAYAAHRTARQSFERSEAVNV